MIRLRLHQVILIAFCAFVLVASVTLVPATLNYLEFWVALSHLYLRIDAFNWSRMAGQTGNWVNISGALFLFHNSSYAGLKLHSVDVKIEYGDQFEYLLEKRFSFYGVPVEPFSRFDLSLFNETTVVSNDFIQSRERGEPVQLHFSTSVNLYLLGQTIADRVYLDVVDYTLY